MNKIDKKIIKYLERAEEIMLKIWSHVSHEDEDHDKQVQVEIAKMIQREELNKDFIATHLASKLLKELTLI